MEQETNQEPNPSPLPTLVALTDPRWHEYVMSQFFEDEVDKGYPKLTGLRRVAEKLIGPIQYSDVTVMQHPNADNEYRVAVKYSLTINDSNLKFADNTKGLNLHFSDVGEAFTGNVEGEYRKHLYGVAVSRAEARVLRKLLRLKVVSVDEIESGVPEETINNSQLNTLNTICSRENINVNKMLSVYLEKYGRKDYRKLLHREASEILREINDNKVKFAQEFSGYESNWQ